jgi:hypothetical protein
MNNPPAFPVSFKWGDELSEYNGMTLRDYFAAKAMQGLMGWSTRVGCPDEAIAHDAYALADAMLKAREA